MARSVTFAPKSACSDPTRDPEGLGVTVSRAIADNEWVSNAGHWV